MKKCYCIELGCNNEISKFNFLYESGRCRSCASKGKRNGNFKHGKCFNNKCIDCGKRISYYGERCQVCSAKELSRRYLSDGNPSWIDGRSYEYYPFNFNNNLKDQIRKRDNYTCQKCGKSQKDNIIGNKQQKLDVHHIDYIKENCNEDNLISLCRNCNGEVNINRDYWYGYFKYIMGE